MSTVLSDGSHLAIDKSIQEVAISMHKMRRNTKIEDNYNNGFLEIQLKI